MAIGKEFQESFLSFARDCYSPGDKSPLSHGMALSQDGKTSVYAFACDVDPAQRTELLREQGLDPEIVCIAHAFESFGISSENKTPANLMKYGPRYENWPDTLAFESVTALLESRDGDAEMWSAKVKDGELGEFEKGKASGRMAGFFPDLSDTN